MKTKKIWFLILLLLPFTLVRADEGMWFLMHIDRLNHRDMQKMGLQLTSEEIYSINHSSLKDAIVQFGGGCTAEIVSKDGLVLTNHHCGYGSIAELSTPEHDYLTNGFWARSRPEELKPKSLSVRFFVRMDDVSKRILSKVNEQMTEYEREQIINREIARIEQENNEGGKYVVSVKSFYNGNEYYYFVYQDYNDVRLVGTPPNSIGKFGGDTDNWEWPRHTGDFSLFRVYADKDGNPAEYSESNVPLNPRYHLPISLKGFQENDFAMILGYPGRTNRWMPAAGIDQNVNFAYPAWVEASKIGMDNLKKHMDQNQQVKLEYAPKYAQVANYWKNRQGMIDALSKHQTATTKRADEAKFNLWANKKENKAQFGQVIETINQYYERTNERSRHDNYMMGMLRSSTFAALPYVLGRALLIYADGTDAKRSAIKSDIEAEIANQYETLYLPLEQDVLAAELNLYASKAKAGGLAPLVDSISQATHGVFGDYIKQAFASSLFASKEKLFAFLANPKAEQVEQDPLFLLSSAIMTRYRYTDEAQKREEADFQRAFRLMVEGMRQANPKKVYYPDANSTLRLTYGRITALPADPQNDAKENYYTTLKGTVAKYKPKDEEFDLPQKLIDLYEAKDFGRYADQKGYLPVNFLTNNDITGGNSGSPVINGKGELIGIAFDGNIEAMAGDVIFDHQLQRTIAVDIRYVLFIMDKFAGAKHLVDEMTIAE
ncbi:S46 family peptidase [Olivibacter sp. CPCC 100613]|uniref:S46 family peptidase n=1 Tax=Olivibacter sp. CPCC 100613 TaxID=3079931 RepID=UPI002FF8B2E5